MPTGSGVLVVTIDEYNELLKTIEDLQRKVEDLQHIAGANESATPSSLRTDSRLTPLEQWLATSPSAKAPHQAST